MLGAHIDISKRCSHSSSSNVFSVGELIPNADHFELNVGEQDTRDADKGKFYYHQWIPV